jgi:hypothetical protein
MGATPPAPTARRRWRRIARGVGALLALAVLALVLAYATRERWLAPFLAGALERRLARASGAEVHIGALGGDWLETLELRELTWRDARPGAALAELEVALARARWHPWRLARGKTDWLERVEVEGLLVRARAGGSAGSDDAGAARGAFEVPARFPSTRIVASDIELELPAGRIALRSAQLEIQPPAAGSQGARLNARVATWAPRAGPARSAELEADLEWSAPRLAVESLRLAGVERLHDSWLDLGAVGGGELAARAQLSAFGGELAADAALRGGVLDCELTLADVELDAAFEIVAPQLAERPGGVVTGNATLHLAPNRPQDFEATFDARATNLSWTGRDLDELEAAGSIARGALSLREVRAVRGTGSLSAVDVVVPLGRGAEETLRGARGELTLRATDLPAWLDTARPPGSIASRVPAHALELGARLTEAGLELDSGRLTTTGGTLDVRPSAIAWGPPGSLLEEARFDLDLGLEFADLAPLGPVLAMPGRWAGSLRGAAALGGTLRALEGEVDLEGEGVVVADLELGELRARAGANAQRVRVAELRTSGALGQLELSGTWIPAEMRFVGARLRASLAAPQTLLPSVFARGSIEVEAEGEGTLSELGGKAQVRARDVELLALGGHTLQSLDLTARVEPGRVAVEELVLRAADSELSATGAFGHVDWRAPYTIELQSLAARRGSLELALAEPARATWEQGAFDTGPVRFAGSAGELELDLAGSGGDLALELRATRLDPMPLLAPLAPRGFLAEGIEGHATLEVSGNVLRADAALEVGRLIPAEGVPELSFNAHGTLLDGRANVDRFELARAGTGSLSLSGEAPFDPLAGQRFGAGPLALRGRFELEDLGRLPVDLSRTEVALTGRIGVDFDLAGEWSRAQGSLEVEGSELALVSRSGTPLFGPATLAARVQAEEGSMQLSDVHLRAPAQLDLTGGGSLGLALAPADWITGSVAAIGSAPLDVRLDFAAADLAFLARLADGVRRVAGRVEGSLVLAGTLAEPEPLGTLRVRDGALRFAGDVPPFEAVQAELQLERQRPTLRDRLSLVALSGEMGGAPLSASGWLEWGAEREPEIELALEGHEVLIVQQPTLRLRSDANLSVRGPFSALEVTGELELRDGRYTKRVELFRRDGGARAAPGPPIELFSFESGPLSTLRLDVAITSRDPFRVENNLVQGALRADLRLTGTGQVPELLGALFVDPTRVQLPATTLESTSGTLVFQRDDPLMPVLDVRLETRVRGYDVAVHASGPIDDPELELNSIPPLPSEDLLVLVLTGKPPDLTWDANTGEQAAQTVAFYVGKDLLSDWFGGSGGGEASWLDRIEYRTGVDMTASGEETTEVMVRVAGTGRSAAGRTVWLRAENDAYDRVNYGVRLLFRLK